MTERVFLYLIVCVTVVIVAFIFLLICYIESRNFDCENFHGEIKKLQTRVTSLENDFILIKKKVKWYER